MNNYILSNYPVFIMCVTNNEIKLFVSKPKKTIIEVDIDLGFIKPIDDDQFTKIVSDSVTITEFRTISFTLQEVRSHCNNLKQELWQMLKK